MAPYNPYILQKNNIDFAFTLDGLKNKKEFLKNIRKAVNFVYPASTPLTLKNEQSHFAILHLTYEKLKTVKLGHIHLLQ